MKEITRAENLLADDTAIEDEGKEQADIQVANVDSLKSIWREVVADGQINTSERERMDYSIACLSERGHVLRDICAVSLKNNIKLSRLVGQIATSLEDRPL